MSKLSAVPVMPQRDDVTAKVDRAVLDDCRIAAAFVGMTLSEYCSDRLRKASGSDIKEGIRKREEAEAKAKPEGSTSPKKKG